MKRKVKMVLMIAVTILISMTLIFVVYKITNPKEKNIFDEMYYGEKKVYNWIGDSPFGKIAGIKDWNRKDMRDTTMREDTRVYENYEDKYKSKKLGEWSIIFGFQYDEKKVKIMDITCNNDSMEMINVYISNKYEIDKKIMEEKIFLIDYTLPSEKRSITEIPKIKEYLKKAGISIKDLKETADELLYEKVIGDWEKYTDSKYSKENMGTVKIERSPLFENID